MANTLGRYLGIALIVLTGCSSGSLFNEPQPLDVTVVFDGEVPYLEEALAISMEDYRIADIELSITLVETPLPEYLPDVRDIQYVIWREVAQAKGALVVIGQPIDRSLGGQASLGCPRFNYCHALVRPQPTPTRLADYFTHELAHILGFDDPMPYEQLLAEGVSRLRIQGINGIKIPEGALILLQ